MSDCVFCKIVDGDIAAEVVLETEHAVAFLDANPVVDGHTVVVPREHAERFSDLMADDLAGLFAAVQKVNDAILAGLDADGSNIGLNDGRAAGQAIPHTHIHLIPRYSAAGRRSLHSIVEGEAGEYLGDVCKKLKSKISSD